MTALTGTTVLGLSRRLRTRPITNRPRTPRWGQGRTQTRSYVFDIRRASLTSSLTTCDFVSQQRASPAPLAGTGATPWPLAAARRRRRVTGRAARPSQRTDRRVLAGRVGVT